VNSEAKARLRAYCRAQPFTRPHQELLYRLVESAFQQVGEMTRMAQRTALLLQFQLCRGAPVDVASLLAPETLGEFSREAGEVFDLDQSTINTYMGSLWKVRDANRFRSCPRGRAGTRRSDYPQAAARGGLHPRRRVGLLRRGLGPADSQDA
jgi:hypothetical protein